MLTGRPLKGGSAFIARHLQANDYWSENEKIVGQWYGRGAERIGLAGEVTTEQLTQAGEGLSPMDGEKLRMRMREDGRSFFDFTVSAPKSSSVMSMVDDRIPEAHRKAVGAFLVELEKLACYEVKDGKRKVENRYTGNLMIARYEHDTSRELDPQLHTHCLTMNMTQDEHGNWRALESREIFRRQNFLTEVYRNALARELTELGYEMDGYDIKGVPKHILDKFSQRSKQKQLAIEQFTDENGREPTKNEVGVLVKETRADKLKEITSEEVKRLQASRLTESEHGVLNGLFSKAQASDHTKEHRQELSAPSESIQYALDDIFERKSVARDDEILACAIGHARGKHSLDELRFEMEALKLAGKTLEHRGAICTAESLRREKESVRMANEGVGSRKPIAEEVPEELPAAIKHVLTSHDSVMNLQGKAGHGKSSVLGELKEELNARGIEVYAIAPTNPAVDKLREKGLSNAVTCKRFLDSVEERAMAKGKFLIVDEAGLVGSKTGYEIQKFAHENGCRLLFSGDSGQNVPVEAGDHLKMLEKHSRIQTHRLPKNYRQAGNPQYAEACDLFHDDHEAGWERFEAMGVIEEPKYMDAPKAVAKAYLAANGKAQIVTGTHNDIFRITHALRAELKERGELQGGRVFDRLEPLNWTDAAKRDTRNYEVGMILKFHKATAECERGQEVAVQRADERFVYCLNDGGHEIRVSKKQALAFGVFAKKQIEVAPGDWLQFGENYRGDGFRCNNSDKAQVEAIDDAGNIMFRDGKFKPRDLTIFNHGYCDTTYKAQGGERDHVIVYADHMEKEPFYTAVSRGKEGLKIFTSNKAQLEIAVGISAARESAIELAMAMEAHAHAQGRAAGIQHQSVGQQQSVNHGQQASSPAPSQAQPAHSAVSIDR